MKRNWLRKILRTKKKRSWRDSKVMRDIVRSYETFEDPFDLNPPDKFNPETEIDHGPISGECEELRKFSHAMALASFDAKSKLSRAHISSGCGERMSDLAKTLPGGIEEATDLMLIEAKVKTASDLMWRAVRSEIAKRVGDLDIKDMAAMLGSVGVRDVGDGKIHLVTMTGEGPEGEYEGLEFDENMQATAMQIPGGVAIPVPPEISKKLNAVMAEMMKKGLAKKVDVKDLPIFGVGDPLRKTNGGNGKPN